MTSEGTIPDDLIAACRVATDQDDVLSSECVYTFYNPYWHPQGLLIPLDTSHFIGTAVPAQALYGRKRGIFVRIVQERVVKESSNDTNEAPTPTQLGVGVPGGFAAEQDKYETRSTHSIVVLEKPDDTSSPAVVVEVPYTDETKQTLPQVLVDSVESILHHVSLTTQQQVQSWKLDQEDIPVTKYAANLPFVDNGVVISPDPTTWKCQKTDQSDDNLWLNLSDGFIGGGRRHWDGTGGTNGALDHYEETGKQYPLVVKLGTITAHGQADCYSYAADEDGPVRIPNLAELLAKRGIHVAAMQKTVKSTAELEVELNANYAFDAITEAGAHLQPCQGPGLQGLQNLGNSCYMNSVLQSLFSLPELADRYGIRPGQPLHQHPLLQQVSPGAAVTDLLCQTARIASALTSGVFCKPLDLEDDDTDPKYRLAPRLFKHVIGKDHVEFATMQQQDAAQFLQYLLERLDRAELGYPQAYFKKNDDKVHCSSHLFSFSTTTRLVCSADDEVKCSQGAPETLWSLRIPMEKAKQPETLPEESSDVVTSPDQKRLKQAETKQEPVPTISLDTCIQEWAQETVVHGIRWSHLHNATHDAKQKLAFSNFPRYLWIQMQRYQLGPDWQPIKLQVELDIPQELDLTSWQSTGPQPGEDLVPPEDETTATRETAAPVIDEVALAQLMEMGFSLNSCKRALVAVGGSNVEAAMGWVFEHNTDPDFNDPLPGNNNNASADATAGVDEGVVESLVSSLGCFTADQVRAALKETNGAPDRAADWLFSHMDDLDAAISALGNRNEQQNNNSPRIPLEDGPGKYTLVGMISHIGKHTGSGHYIAHLKKNGQWVIFNDEKVALSSEPPFPHAYLYLFQRTDTIGSPHPNY